MPPWLGDARDTRPSAVAPPLPTLTFRAPPLAASKTSISQRRVQERGQSSQNELQQHARNPQAAQRNEDDHEDHQTAQRRRPRRPPATNSASHSASTRRIELTGVKKDSAVFWTGSSGLYSSSSVSNLGSFLSNLGILKRRSFVFAFFPYLDYRKSAQRTIGNFGFDANCC